MQVGTFDYIEPKKGEGEPHYSLSLNIPFIGKTSFFTIENREARGDNDPSFILFCGKNRAGAIWKKVSGKGDEYLSGYVFCIGAPDNRLHFAIFDRYPNGNGEGPTTQEIELERVVVISDGPKPE